MKWGHCLRFQSPTHQKFLPALQSVGVIIVALLVLLLELTLDDDVAVSIPARPSITMPGILLVFVIPAHGRTPAQHHTIHYEAAEPAPGEWDQAGKTHGVRYKSGGEQQGAAHGQKKPLRHLACRQFPTGHALIGPQQGGGTLLTQHGRADDGRQQYQANGGKGANQPSDLNEDDHLDDGEEDEGNEQYGHAVSGKTGLCLPDIGATGPEFNHTEY